MSDYHSGSECEKILSSGEIENNYFNSRDHSEQLDRIIKAKGRLVVYLSIIYGAIIFFGLVYLFIT